MKSRLIAPLTLLVGMASPAVHGDPAAAPRKFTLVYNVNNSGYIDVCGCKHKEVRQGSLTRRSNFLKTLRASGRELLLLDGGSTFFHIADRVKAVERTDAIRKAQVIVKSYNHMGYRAMAVGAYDLAAGIDALLELEKQAKFKLLSANLFDKKAGKLYFEPHAILEVAGVRVGVIGLTLSTLSKPFLRKVAPDARLLDPFESASKSYRELRDKTDIVIALSHLREETNFDLVKKLKGLEVLIDPYVQFGNHHTWIKEEEWLSLREDTLFLRSDGQGARLGLVDIELVKKGETLSPGERLDELAYKTENGEASPQEKAEYVTLRGKNLFRFTRLSLEPHHLTDPVIDHWVEQYKKPGSTPSPPPGGLSKKFTTQDKCESCHEKQHAFWQNTKHAKAYETLTKTGDQHRYDCLGCHTLGYGKAFVDTTKVGKYKDVQCESCHGSKPKHATAPREHAYGSVARLTCISCHNEEQTKIDFNYFRSRKIVACPKG